MGDPVRQLKTFGRDISETFLDRLPKQFERICFICVNSYRSFRQAIGVTPIQDAVALAKCVRYFEYEVYFVHNPHARYFLDYVNFFLEHTSRHLIVYYVGQGTTLRDLDRTMSRDLYDEAFTFDDGAISDEEFLESLTDFKNPDNKVTLITDTCKPETVWNLPLASELRGRPIPPRVISLSAVPTEISSKQMMALCQSQGIFTFNLTKFLKQNPKISAKELCQKMYPILGEFAQEFLAGTSSPETLDEPVLEMTIE
jgi:hypothetical protein